MKCTKKIISSVLAVCMLASSAVMTGFAASTADDVGANEWANAAHALDERYTYDGNDLGAVYSPEKTVFKVWSPTATKVILNRFATGSDSETGAKDLGQITMEQLMENGQWTGVWTATVSGDIADTYYTYTITAADPKSGELQTAETQDVYSVATGVNGKRSMVCDLSKTDPEGWDNDSHVLLDKPTDSQVWEVHVKDFSYDKSSGVSDANRGKYLAFTETGTKLNGSGSISTCVDYLKQQGITTVQINPFYDFQSINEAGDDDQFNWGYDPQNFNVPEGSYSSDPYNGNVRINECKQMIKALHDAGISVVMDVVYNHTYSCDKSDSCFQATVPFYYHRVDSKGAFSNGSGCGNEVSSDYAMTRKYIIDSCMYWVNEYHVDGFRFDLMGLIDTETMNLIREEMDKVDTRLTIWGEGWTGGTSVHESKTCTGAAFYPATQANAAQLNERIAFFNDKIRDGIKGSVFDTTEKGFIAGNATHYVDVANGVRANTDSNGWKSKAPSQTVSYAACHDNATLYDQITSSATKGEYGVRDALGVKLSKMTAAMLNTAQGATFYLAGDEMARTKYGDTNSYKSSPEINKINWQNLVDYADLVSYYQGMMMIRKNFSPFTAADNSYYDSFDFLGKALSGMRNSLNYVVTNDKEGEWKKVAVMHNGAAGNATVDVSSTGVTEWVIIANGDTAGLNAIEEKSGKSFTVPGNTSIIAVDKESFEACALKDERGKVIVNYVNEKGDQLTAPMVILGNIGSGYETAPSSAVPNTLEVKTVQGNASGTFTADTQEVTYIYTNYVPEALKNFGDVNKDGKINIDDVTAMQKALAGSTAYDISDCDFDCDGKVTISDATMLMKYLAGYSVAQGSAAVNHYYYDASGNKKTLTSEVKLTGRVGDPYTTTDYRVMGYTLDKTKLPENAEGVFSYGNTVKVDYYYVSGSLDVKLHLKHTTDNWTPYLWIWGSDLAGKDKGNYTGGTWNKQPPAPLNEETGWFEYDFTYSGAGTYNLIVTNATKDQTRDYKGFVDNELWIIIDDSKISSGKYLNIYTDNPETNPNAPTAQYYIPE